MSTTTMTVTGAASSSSRPVLSRRRSSAMHQDLIRKIRPLPFQYVWSLWHSRPVESYALKQLADSVSDIATFYRIFNNVPWDNVRVKDSVHFFRAGVKPLWEDTENREGGSWTIKVRREGGKATKMWEELCLMVCGGELQAELSSEHDHILGISYSPRIYTAQISIWTKKGSEQKSVELLEQTILSRLSADLKPSSSADYFFRKHSDKEGWHEAVGQMTTISV